MISRKNSAANFPLKPVWRILGLALGLRLLFLIAVPAEYHDIPHRLSAFNDEAAHYNYVRQMAEHDLRPLQIHSIREAQPRGLQDYEYYQPPLFYRLAGYLENILPETMRGIYSARALNLMLGLLLILTVGRVLQLVNFDYAVPGMLLLTALGSVVFFSAVVTNDVLLWLLSALFAYYSLLSMKEPDWRKRAALGLCFAAALWTKLSALTLLPAMLLALYFSFKTRKWGLRIIFTLLWTLFALCWTYPLFRENLRFYGELLPLSVGMGEGQDIFAQISLKRLYLVTNYLAHTFYFPFENYWIGWVQAVIFLAMGLASLGVIYLAIRKLISDYRDSDVFIKKGYLFLGLCLAGALGGLTMMILRFSQSEARLTFTALPAICLLLISGFDRLCRGSRRRREIMALALPALPYLLFLLY